MNNLQETCALLDQVADFTNQSNTQEHFEHVQLNSLMRILQAFLREEILDASFEDNTLVFTLPQSMRTIFIDRIRMGSLFRYTSFGNVYLRENCGSVRQIKNPFDLLDIFISELDSEAERANWDRLIQEINDHLRNALLSNSKNWVLNQKIKKESQELGLQYFLQWVNLQPNRSYFFEQYITRGHPYHPCSKTKLGFSIEDVINYSPEFQPHVPLQLVAVHNTLVHIEAMEAEGDYLNFFAKNYSATWKAWQQYLITNQLNPADYIPIPVHPWQAQNQLPELFADFISKGLLHICEDISISATPTLSFRTLAPIALKDAPYIKLPIAIQATSVFRTLEPKSTQNTPKVSSMLTDIFAKETNFANRLSILRENFGLHLKTVSDEQARNLTVIFRENPNLNLQEGEIAIVVAALFEKSPLSGSALLIDLMQMAGIHHQEDAYRYFQHYVDLVLGSYLDLYLGYGIALEGHQQNTLAVFRDGQIVRFIARDFDGVNIHLSTLEETGYVFKAYPGTSAITQNKQQVRNLLLHTVYQLHLGEVVLTLANHFGCAEDEFWQVVRDTTEQRLLLFKEKLNSEVWQKEAHCLLEADWPCKALLRMRLLKRFSQERLFFLLPNPLRLE